MLGWQILITNQQDVVLASWKAGHGGLEWIDSLVEKGDAERISTDGFPTSYQLKAKRVLPFLRIGHQPDLPEKSQQQSNEVTFNHSAIATCDEEEALVFEAWDLG